MKARYVGVQDSKEVAAIPFPLSTCVARVTNVAAHEKNAHLYWITLDCGEKEPRLAISSLAGNYSAADLKDQSVIAVTNVKPAGTPKVTASILVADAKDSKDPTKRSPVLLTVDSKQPIQPGTKIAPKGVKVVPTTNFAIKTALPGVGLVVSATGAALYGAIPLEAAGGVPVIADKKAVSTAVII